MSIPPMNDDYIQSNGDRVVGEFDIEALRTEFSEIRMEEWNHFGSAYRDIDGRLIRPKRPERSRVVITVDSPSSDTAHKLSCDLLRSAVNTTTDNRRRKLVCNYCGCISGKESGTCEHCGAPLVYEE